MTIEVGDKVANFSLPNQHGEQISLDDYKGKQVIVYFYPKDMTPGCTTQACDFRDQHDSFKDLNTVILGISTDPVARHQKFVEKYDLPFHLLADEEHEVAEQFGVWQLKKNFGKEYMGIVRSTFILNEAGELVKAYRKVKVNGHVEEALQYLKENQ